MSESRYMQQMTLGELIAALQRVPPDSGVRFDFCSHVPTTVDSYRGYYEQLALGYSAEMKSVKVAELLKVLRDAIGKDFTGYKGGTYTMHHGTHMWVANYRETGSTAIVGVLDAGWCVVLQTGWCD